MQVQVIILAPAIADAPLDDPSAVSSLVKSLRAIGDRQVTALLQRDPAAHVWLDDPTAVGELLNSLRAAGADQQAAALAGRAAAESPVDDTLGVTGLLAALREPEAFTVLAERAIAQVPRHDPAAVGALLISLREAGAQDQITTLLRQDPAAHAALHHADDVIMLMNSLREAGAEDLVTVLIDRLPGAGMFELFRQQDGRQDRFRFGREADGSPASPWGWKIWKTETVELKDDECPGNAGMSTDVVGYSLHHDMRPRRFLPSAQAGAHPEPARVPQHHRPAAAPCAAHAHTVPPAGQAEKGYPHTRAPLTDNSGTGSGSDANEHLTRSTNLRHAAGENRNTGPAPSAGCRGLARGYCGRSLRRSFRRRSRCSWTCTSQGLSCLPLLCCLQDDRPAGRTWQRVSLDANKDIRCLADQ